MTFAFLAKLNIEFKMLKPELCGKLAFYRRQNVTKGSLLLNRSGVRQVYIKQRPYSLATCGLEHCPMCQSTP